MLHELDFIESDWAALFWALGSTTAIFRQSVPRGFRAWLGRRLDQVAGMRRESIGKRAAGVTTGIALALAVTISAFALVSLLFYLFPAWDLGPVPRWIGVIVIPEMIFIVTAVALWRKRRSMAAGIVLSAIVLAAHFAVHLAANAH